MVIVAANGQLRRLTVSGQPLVSPDGRKLGAVVSMHDITDRQRLDEAKAQLVHEQALQRGLKESEERFRLLANTIPNMAWMARPDGNLFWYNQRWYDYTGSTPEEMAGTGWQKAHHPDTLPEVWERWKLSLESGAPFNMVFPLRGQDGVFRPFLTLVSPFRGADGQIMFWFGTDTDISEQKRAEEELARAAEAERRRSELFTQVADASQTLNAVLSVEAISQTLADKTRRILRSQVAHVVLTCGQDCDDELSAVSVSEERAHERDAQGRLNGLGEQVCQTNHSLRLTGADVRAHLASSDPTAADAPPRSWLGVPLIGHGGRNLGFIGLSDKVDGEFTVEDEAVLTQLAATASVGLENARLYAALREEDKRKDEFLAVLAHELRNPLAPVRTGLQILKVTDTEGKFKSTGEMMERQIAQMVRLVDDLIDVSRVSHGRLELKLEPTALRAVFDAAAETSFPLIQAAGHSLQVVLPDELLEVNVDLTRIAQVLSNLLNNAAKYTPDGGLLVLSAELDANHVAIKVTDTGIGIPKAMLSRVFELFTQVKGGVGPVEGGLGIGLSLVKHLVELHGGTVSAASRGENQGSTFTIELPLCQDAPPPPEPFANRGTAPAAPTPPMRLLVVDDNVDGAGALAMLLGLLGHTTRIAYNGNDALVAAAEFLPDMIFLDIGMPGMSGYDVARIIRDNPSFQNMKIIAVTGWGSEDDRSRSHAAGFNAHLTKPVNPTAITEILQLATAESDVRVEPKSRITGK